MILSRVVSLGRAVACVSVRQSDALVDSNSGSVSVRQSDALVDSNSGSVSVRQSDALVDSNSGSKFR